MFFSVGNSSADSTEVDIIARIHGVISITTDASGGDLPLDIVPKPTGTLSKNALTVTVSTNSHNGYTLNMNSKTTNTSLVHELATGNPPAPNIPSASHDYNSPAALGTDTWGWNLGEVSSTTTFSKIPPSDDSQTIKVTAEPSSLTNPSIANTIVTFGANVTDDMAAGAYINTIVFTATSNYVPPDDDWAINDAAATITTFDEYGVLTSNTGLIPIDYTNSTTYANTTTQTVGLANFNIVKGYLNNKQQIDVDAVYYLEQPNNSTDQILGSLASGDPVRIRGVGDVHGIVYRRRNYSQALFEFNVPVNLYVQNIDFEVGDGTPVPKDSRVFGYRVQENWVSTTFLVDEIIFRDCSFKGPVTALYFVATPPSGFSADRLGPSRHVIDKIAFHNNTVTDVATLSGVLHVADPYVKEFRITNNTIRNSGWIIISFLSDNVSNITIDGSTAHNDPDRASSLVINSNEYINDDSFDMWLAWKDVREVTSTPWGARPTWVRPTEYFTLIVHKGSQDITFSRNYVEGINTWNTGDQYSTAYSYAAYLSGRRVLYENNIIKNVVEFNVNKNYEGNVMFKFKESYGFDNSNRIVRNNEFTIEEDFPERILGTQMLTAMPAVDVLDMLAVRISQTTGTPWETFIFENNFIDVPSLVPYINDFYIMQHAVFNDNVINTDYIRSFTNGTLSAFLAMAPETVWPASVSELTRTMIGNTINVRKANTIDTVAARRNVALVVGTSPYPSTINVEGNTFNMGDLLAIFSPGRNGGNTYDAGLIPNMTLDFNNNIVTTNPAGNITKKRTDLPTTTVFNQFNSNTTSPGFNFIGSN